jgi:ABC-type molybdenum transport system ATPase subunit/photorepair protein PhrA
MTRRNPIGTNVIFISKYGETSHSGQRAIVVAHGNDEDPSGIAHVILFDDGHTLTAYPQELAPSGTK